MRAHHIIKNVLVYRYTKGKKGIIFIKYTYCTSVIHVDYYSIVLTQESYDFMSRCGYTYTLLYKKPIMWLV